ncbi:hypothetical protein [Kamptonema formosum]|uniref:hypothetical protein n=1 Tax=Kamptonema formosum TaxID=331992 RepID=UPI000347F8BA|nr:hypothetical protein [Oscillatoria sp. PCC 10802]
MLLQQQDERNGQSKPKRAAEIYEVICNQISSENDLLNQRVNWLVISQSFLFSAYASLLNAPKEAKDAVVDSTTDGYPPIQEKLLARKLGGLPPTVVPLLFIEAWVVILIFQFLRSGCG